MQQDRRDLIEYIKYNSPEATQGDDLDGLDDEELYHLASQVNQEVNDINR